MTAGDGNGWVACRCGARHWGRHGAAGLLLVRVAASEGARADEMQVLLQRRAPWVHQGGTWGVPGGAADSHEDPVTAALREAAEEAAVDSEQVSVVDVLVGVDHQDWRYDLVVGAAHASVRPLVANAESDDARWVPVADVAALVLHPGFAASWDRVLADLAAREAGTWTVG